MKPLATGPSIGHYPLPMPHLFKHTRRVIRALLVTVVLVLLNACGTKYSSTPPNATATPAPAATIPVERTDTLPTAPTAVSPEIRPTSIPDEDAPRSLPAAVALREQAITAAAANNHNRAIGLLERAIRISPSDPATFTVLAESHLAQNRPQQALELTRRALTLNPTLEQQLTLEALEQKCLALL